VVYLIFHDTYIADSSIYFASLLLSVTECLYYFDFRVCIFSFDVVTRMSVVYMQVLVGIVLFAVFFSSQILHIISC
jgi:hypothetical protein